MIGFLFRSKPKPAADPAPAVVHPYVCVQHWPVTIFYQVEVAVCHGDQDPVTAEHAIHLVWHSEIYTRDDILDSRIQNRQPRIVVGEPVRRYFPTADVRLESWESRLMVICPQSTNGYLAGFAPTLLDAMAYVATGKATGLLRLW